MLTLVSSTWLLFGCSSSQPQEESINATHDAVVQNALDARSNEIDETGGAVSADQHATDISRLQLAIGGETFDIELADNETAAAFTELLPLQVNMSELNGNEKYIFLDTTLPTNASTPATIEAGDVMLYQNRCIVVFYKTHSNSYSYTRIGKISDTTGLEESVGSGDVEMTFSV